jgi:hypothetical protein
VNETLFAQVKRKLNITWNDEDTDSLVKDIISSAIPIMLHKLGITDENFDFSKPGAENNLFRAYCLYEFNHCANEFDANYSNEIAQTRDKNILKQYTDETEGTENAEA